MHRCAHLTVSADNSTVVDDVLLPLQAAFAPVLQGVLVNFRSEDYSDFRPFAMHNFVFSGVAPLFAPFPPFTTLCWTRESVAYPTINYSTGVVASCWALHLTDRPADWTEAMAVITSSSALSVLVLDRIVLECTPGRIRCSPPLYALRVLVLTFGDSPSMAALVLSLNIPTLHTLHVTLASVVDFHTLLSCRAILSVVVELYIFGSPPEDDAYWHLFSLLHRVVKLDLLLAGPAFYSSFVHASRLPSPVAGINWNASPALQHILVGGLSLSHLRGLVLDREAARFPQLESIFTQDPEDGGDAALRAWFQARSILIYTS
ncbi:hypothetical protein B0H17DRAFT_1190126 [Mycena rosella]|uniref:Uncharacterized protein n=1 Tax=Mycena rosella TaxID=1033263 RepID=A0AAD7MC54_MYCRO|nr:hypothetical protein B0H17DRAFT_1190126 [Mycena rosella]